MPSTHPYSLPLRVLWVLALAALIALALSPLPLEAQERIEMAVEPAFGGNYSPGKWLPLVIVLRNQGSDTQVLVAAALPGAASRNTLAVELPGGGEKRVTLYAAMDGQARELLVTLERAGSRLAEQKIELRPRADERLLAVIAAQPLPLRLPRRQDLVALPLLMVEQSLATLPEHAAGFASLSLMLIGEAPTEQLNPAQRQAIWAWVNSGGHLVVTGGPAAERVLAGLPEALHAARIGPPVTLDGGALATLTATTAPAALQGVTLAALGDGLPFGSEQAPLWVQRTVGNGRVTQLAFDPGAAALRDWAGAPALWDALLRPPLQIGIGGAVEFSPSYARDQIIAAALGNLPTINLPRSEPLFALLIVYTLLIGPGIALLLRRSDRQASGWIVLPLLALVTFALALSLALVMRADQRIVSQITLIEQVGPEFAQARTVAAVLSPQAARFTFDTPQGALLRPLPSIAGTFVSLDGIAGDMGQQTNQFTGEAKAWELQGIRAQGEIAFKALDAQLTVGANAAQLVVRNTTGQALNDVVAVYADQALSLGDLSPEEQRAATWPPLAGGAGRVPIGISPSQLVLGAELAAGNQPGHRLERSLLIHEALINAATTRGTLEGDPGPFVFALLTHNPWPVTIAAEGAARQEMALLVTRPRIAGAAGAALAQMGWLRPDPLADERGVCRGNFGSGLSAAPAPLTVTLRLPPMMASFRADELILALNSDRPWPSAGVRTMLYDWQRATWVEFDFDGPGRLRVPGAGVFMRAGRVRLSLDGRITEAGCVFIEGQARGTLP